MTFSRAGLGLASLLVLIAGVAAGCRREHNDAAPLPVNATDGGATRKWEETPPQYPLPTDSVGGRWFPEAAHLKNPATFKDELSVVGESPIYAPFTVSQYRLLCVRSFDPPIIVRIVNATPDNYVLMATRGDRHGGGTIVRRQRSLSQEESRVLQARLKSSHLVWIESQNDIRGLDGEQWLIEESTTDGYRVVERWSPHVPRTPPVAGLEAFRELGEYFLKLAGPDIVVPDPR